VKGNRDLELTTAAAVLCAVLGLLLPVAWLSLLVSLPLFFLLPGYAITAVVVARHARGPAQTLALALGVSLVVLSLGGVFLNYMPGGLQPLPWAIFLVLVTVLACRGAAVRRRPGYVPTLPRRPRLFGNPLAAALTIAGAAIAIGAIALAFVTFEAPDAVGYTELWMQPGASSEAVVVGVGSEEQEQTSYRLEVETPGAGKAETRRLSLRPGESEILRVPTPGGASGKPERVVALLYKKGEPGRPYRRVNAWIGNKGAGE
jgi:uncharacterized membrane protein